MVGHDQSLGGIVGKVLNALHLKLTVQYQLANTPYLDRFLEFVSFQVVKLKSIDMFVGGRYQTRFRRKPNPKFMNLLQSYAHTERVISLDIDDECFFPMNANVNELNWTSQSASRLLRSGLLKKFPALVKLTITFLTWFEDIYHMERIESSLRATSPSLKHLFLSFKFGNVYEDNLTNTLDQVGKFRNTYANSHTRSQAAQ
ncbi:unnamed protein product [Ambrosiozyma monospora]|uniref:Unnamed protein product n=1 Tax=Ambrosiozyma monospora TaxID=43982 RepID=A0ACB5T4A3_AMBMO|nr:unnamed protein product [Ambrosiozyma monospora]